MSKPRQLLVAAVVALLASPLLAPQLLAFPHRATVGGHAVYSETPLDPRIGHIVADADRRLARSPIARPAGEPIFLTAGGWRWRWLAGLSSGSFALTRPLRSAVIVNRSDVSADRVFNRGVGGGSRPLSDVLVHEMTHNAIRDHFGPLADARYPRWLREGYSDYVAGGGSLSDAEARRLIANREEHPALVYWRGRKRVEAELARNGGSVDALFANAGA